MEIPILHRGDSWSQKGVFTKCLFVYLRICSYRNAGGKPANYISNNIEQTYQIVQYDICTHKNFKVDRNIDRSIQIRMTRKLIDVYCWQN